MSAAAAAASSSSLLLPSRVLSVLSDRVARDVLMVAFWLLAYSSLAAIPVAVILPIIFPVWPASYSLALILFTYYLFRYWHGTSYWRDFHRFLVVWNRRHPYFDAQELVFDCDGTVLSSDLRAGRVLICHSPHGITACGWAMNGVLGEYFLDFRIHWLAVGELLLLPFISDLLLWIGADSADKAPLEEMMKRGENLAILLGGFEEVTDYSFLHSFLHSFILAEA